jgi:hypothetical protein
MDVSGPELWIKGDVPALFRNPMPIRQVYRSNLTLYNDGATKSPTKP